jgi:hypothetical protein
VLHFAYEIDYVIAQRLRLLLELNMRLWPLKEENIHHFTIVYTPSNLGMYTNITKQQKESHVPRVYPSSNSNGYHNIFLWVK